MQLLLPQTALRDTHTWATVTQASPLRIKVDGETTALPFTPDTLEAGLAVDDRVWIGFSTNDDLRFLGRRVVVMGRAGGTIAVPSHTHTEFTTNAVPSANGVSSLSTTSGSDTCTSSSYQSMTGTGSQTSFSFTKRFGSAISRIKVTIHQTLYQSGGSLPFAQLGALVNGTDYDLIGATISGSGVNTMMSGFAYIPSIAAGVYTIQARWKRVSGTGTLTRDTLNWLAFEAMEVSV